MKEPVTWEYAKAWYGASETGLLQLSGQNKKVCCAKTFLVDRQFLIFN